MADLILKAVKRRSIFVFLRFPRPGRKIVMRLLKKSGGVPELPELGLRGRGLKNLQDAILRPHGIS